MKLRNPAPFGILRGPGVVAACANFLDLEELQLIEISFQLITDSRAIVGYADMDYSTGEGVLHYLFGLGDKCEVRLESCTREIYLGDFGIYLNSENDMAIASGRW